MSPCGRCATLPSACPSAWSAAQSERFIARPAVRLAHASCRRASASAPSATARASDCATWRQASSPNATESGDEFRTVQPPIAWARASTPECAVGPAGSPCVSTGSTSACCARMFGCPKPTFRSCSVSVRTLAPETSLPVPAVVGQRTSADPRRGGYATTRRVVGGAAALVGHEPCRLRDVERRAAADPHDRVVGRRADAFGELVCERERRLPGALDEALEADAARLAGHERPDDVEVLGDGLLDDDQRAPRAERLEDARQLVDDPVAEGDPHRQVRGERGAGRRHAVARSELLGPVAARLVDERLEEALVLLHLGMPEDTHREAPGGILEPLERAVLRPRRLDEALPHAADTLVVARLDAVVPGAEDLGEPRALLHVDRVLGERAEHLAVTLVPDRPRAGAGRDRRRARCSAAGSPGRSRASARRARAPASSSASSPASRCACAGSVDGCRSAPYDEGSMSIPPEKTTPSRTSSVSSTSSIARRHDQRPAAGPLDRLDVVVAARAPPAAPTRPTAPAGRTR